MTTEQNQTPPPPFRIVEAMLFVGGKPLTSDKIAEVLRGFSEEEYIAAVDELNEIYREQGRPYTIVKKDQGFVLTLRPRYLGVMEKLSGGPREAKLSLAAVDVLALLAYRQPVTKAEIDNLRGHESGALLRQLVRRGLAAVVHRGEANQRDVYYGTTERFLKLFGLESLDDLPRTQELQEL